MKNLHFVTNQGQEVILPLDRIDSMVRTKKNPELLKIYTKDKISWDIKVLPEFDMKVFSDVLCDPNTMNLSIQIECEDAVQPIVHMIYVDSIQDSKDHDIILRFKYWLHKHIDRLKIQRLPKAEINGVRLGEDNYVIKGADDSYAVVSRGPRHLFNVNIPGNSIHSITVDYNDLDVDNLNLIATYKIIP